MKLAGPILTRLLVALLLASAFTARAAPIALTDSERAWLDNHRPIQLAPDPDFAPIEYLDDEGNHRGIAADFIALIEEKLETGFEVVQLSSWTEVLDMARAGHVDLLSAATPSPQREQFLSFTAPHIRLPGVIIVNSSFEGEATLDSIAGQRVAAVAGYIWFDMIANDRPSFSLEPVANLTEGLRQLSFGNIDALISDAATASTVIQREGLTNLKVAGETGYFTNMGFGIRKDWPELKLILDKAVESITDEERSEIFNRWVSIEPAGGGIPGYVWTWIIVGVALTVILAAAGIFWNTLLTRRVAEKTNELNKAKGELEKMNVSLEDRVKERTRELEKAYERLKDSQGQLVQSEKMAAIGQMVAGVAHEINTPLGYVHNNVQMMENFIAMVKRFNDEFNVLTDLMNSSDADDDKISEQFQLVQTLAAKFKQEDAVEETTELVKDAVYGLEQISDLVLSLKDFSRVDRATAEDVDIHDNIRSTLKVCHNLLKNTCRVVTEFGNLPKLHCMPSQINQVLLNLITNAAHAIQESGKFGTLYIQTHVDEGFAYVTVQDDGVGMDTETGKHIFEPFYSTKKTGSGTGLGLSITYNILKNHNAKVKVRSRPGKGTKFQFGLPTEAEQVLRKSA